MHLSRYTQLSLLATGKTQFATCLTAQRQSSCKMNKKAGNRSVIHSLRSAEDGHFIWRAWKIDPRTGDRMYAKDYGFKAWRIWVADDTPKSNQADDS